MAAFVIMAHISPAEYKQLTVAEHKAITKTLGVLHGKR
jgi:hypothetical protein